ncbi:MAG: hypothetical protein K2X47_00965, partial [Bdellovibrionales bacterium]|nr:hypothetical protein [Bdellovibrionales bacterium]
MGICLKKELTISRIFQRHVTRLTVFVGILFLVICSVQAILLSLQSHRNACLLFGQRVAEAEGPLARELGLGESLLAREIFSDLESKLTATGASTNLGLLVGAQFVAKAETCNASAFSAQVSYPIRFGDMNVATIEGSIWSFPTAPFFFGVLGVLAVLV